MERELHYLGATPTKLSDDTYDYEFKGWTPELETVKGPQAYTAVFNVKMRPRYSISLDLADSFGINLYVGGFESFEGMTVSWTQRDGTEVEMLLTDGTQVGEWYVLRIDNMPAKEMTDVIPVTIKDADGEELRVLNCSVKAYCEAALKSEQVSDSVKELCRAALAYGATAQLRFDYNADDLADPDYAARLPESIPSNEDTAVSRSALIDGVTGFSASLNLISQTEMNVYIQRAKGATPTDFSFTVKKNGAAYENFTVVESGDNSIVTIHGISAPNLTTPFTVEVTKGDQTFTATLTPLAYARFAQANETEGTVVRGLYQYAMAAKGFK